MPENFRDIKKRIDTVAKTQKIVRAMKMVSAAKLSRATRAIEAARPYAEKLRGVLGSVAAGVEADAHPLLEVREKVRRVDVVLFTSDRGLCGAYNSNLCKYTERLLAERAADLDSASVLAVGRKAQEHFARRKRDVPEAWTGLGNPNPIPEIATAVAKCVTQRFLEGAADEVILVYSRFMSALTQRPGHEVLLPLSPPRAEESSTADRGAYEIEPNAASLLGGLIPRAVEYAIMRALLEEQAGEHGARMTAMDSATTNTEELIRTLTLRFNKVRQSAITAELVEIVSGSEAL